MIDIQYVGEGDICAIVEQECEFLVEDRGIGHYEYGDGKYTDKNLQLSLTTQDIMVQYPIDSESMIYTLVVGTHYLTDGKGMDYECDYMVELSHIEYNIVTKGFEATYEVNEQ